MFRCAITNVGRAWLMEPEDLPVHRALAAIADPLLEAENPDAVYASFCDRLHERLDPSLPTETLSALWHELGHNALIKVRRPAPPDMVPAFVHEDPPVEFYLKSRRAGKREGAGAKPRDADGRLRIQRSVMLAPDVNEAILAAQQPGEAYSETVDRLIREAVTTSAR